MLCQPAPSIGPKLGATLGLRFDVSERAIRDDMDRYPQSTTPTKESRSAGLAMSETTPYAIAIVLAKLSVY